LARLFNYGRSHQHEEHVDHDHDPASGRRNWL
jgi:hypothetical protein